MDLVLACVFFHDNEMFYTTSLKQSLQQISLKGINFQKFQTCYNTISCLGFFLLVWCFCVWVLLEVKNNISQKP